MPVTALKSESTVLALKLKKSVRKARDALSTAGSWTGPAAALGGVEDARRTRVPSRPSDGQEARHVGRRGGWGRTVAAAGDDAGRRGGWLPRRRRSRRSVAPSPCPSGVVAPDRPSHRGRSSCLGRRHLLCSPSVSAPLPAHRSAHRTISQARRLVRRREGRAPQARNRAGTSRPPRASSRPSLVRGHPVGRAGRRHGRARAELDVGLLGARRHEVAAGGRREAGLGGRADAVAEDGHAAGAGESVGDGLAVA